jgi:hypothetical protein
MLKISANQSRESRRFEYAPGVAFWVRPVTASILQELRRKCVTSRMAPNRSTRQLESVDELDHEKFDATLADYILERWEGVAGEDGRELPVSPESKKLVLDQLELSEFIWAAAKSLDATGPELKNS